ncbi:class I SAM-dependent methyltransferase [Lactococcus termiticola]|uniref:SAM-dependent methyltransferase n=1 Tax=Lactococcus termiticola TaxID=2169526 RepID=A0A2R5HKP2_9LACT|nr:class I SAM-dependent methyltransferase [Lactococcus termiticola]GBG97490.1 SAM-dependent methyltransferase [Lactococcus termiticola]
MIKIQEMAHALLADVIKPGDLAVDATMGNGYDTVFLAGLGAKTVAFDVQAEALEATQAKLEEAGLSARLIHDGHEQLANYIQEPVKAAVFNLGYLPGTDKSIVTTGDHTIQALDALLDLLEVAGRIVLVVYHGHPGGQEEKKAVVSWAESLPQQAWHVMAYAPMNQVNHPPFLIVVEKR